MSALPSKPLSVTRDEYFRREALSEQRHEYTHGRIVLLTSVGMRMHLAEIDEGVAFPGELADSP